MLYSLKIGALIMLLLVGIVAIVAACIWCAVNGLSYFGVSSDIGILVGAFIACFIIVSGRVYMETIV